MPRERTLDPGDPRRVPGSRLSVFWGAVGGMANLLRVSLAELVSHDVEVDVVTFEDEDVVLWRDGDEVDRRPYP